MANTFLLALRYPEVEALIFPSFTWLKIYGTGKLLAITFSVKSTYKSGKYYSNVIDQSHKDTQIRILGSCSNKELCESNLRDIPTPMFTKKVNAYFFSTYKLSPVNNFLSGP